MQFFIRTLESLIYPVGFLWLCLTVSAGVLYRKKHKGAGLACALMSGFLYIAGATPVPEWLMARLERPFANAIIANAARADVVILLGGNANPSAHDSFQISLNSASDRIVTAVELLRQNKANALIIGGGPARLNRKPVSEGALVEHFVKTWNVAPGEVIGLDACVNTREEAMRAHAIMAERKWTNAILVTSAFHMARALATFQKQGLAVLPVACDFEALPVVEGESWGFRVVPTIDHLKTLTLYLHEVIGWYYYSARGWV